MVRLSALLVVILAVARQVDAHGAMITPASRNAIDSTIPGADWGNGTNKTGHLEPLSVKCTNGTDDCRPGQSVFWFSQGCTPGCEACDGELQDPFILFSS
jgi:predicted carbohydrate-binding protein with CBM5 and CBM33 domain